LGSNETTCTCPDTTPADLLVAFFTTYANIENSAEIFDMLFEDLMKFEASRWEASETQKVRCDFPTKNYHEFW
jgi:hypothetical protein